MCAEKCCAPQRGKSTHTYGMCQSLTNSLCDCRSHYDVSAPTPEHRARHGENRPGPSTCQQYLNGPAGGACILQRKESVNALDGEGEVQSHIQVLAAVFYTGHSTHTTKEDDRCKHDTQ
jgi:hypothetical protein